ncbi:MAG TPA: polyhydroxyalkanoate synthesis regulator DNA-binding domain-containing protein [Anaeromyxobacteraceae bacterium]|nr:polyhydroxyalkanoate synthesis regulator DNA-binding domain-containing protein [Anaeromyxobacteraceae bacterium]
MNDEQQPEAEVPAAHEPKVIKRYTNRKLYDTVESRYVTLDEIAAMIRAGAEVKVIDNRTREDLTSITLAQIIFEQEKKSSQTSLSTLLGLIRQGGDIAHQLVGGTGAELRDRVQAVFSRGQRGGGRARDLLAVSREAIAALQSRLDERVRTAFDGVSHVGEVRKQLDDISTRLSELERRIDDMEH